MFKRSIGVLAQVSKPVTQASKPVTPASEGPGWVSGRRRGNWIIGVTLFVVVGGIYYTTLRSVSQNDFSEFENEKKLGVKKP